MKSNTQGQRLDIIGYIFSALSHPVTMGIAHLGLLFVVAIFKAVNTPGPATTWVNINRSYRDENLTTDRFSFASQHVQCIHSYFAKSTVSVDDQKATSQEQHDVLLTGKTAPNDGNDYANGQFTVQLAASSVIKRNRQDLLLASVFAVLLKEKVTNDSEICLESIVDVNSEDSVDLTENDDTVTAEDYRTSYVISDGNGLSECDIPHCLRQSWGHDAATLIEFNMYNHIPMSYESSDPAEKCCRNATSIGLLTVHAFFIYDSKNASEATNGPSWEFRDFPPYPFWSKLFSRLNPTRRRIKSNHPEHNNISNILSTTTILYLFHCSSLFTMIVLKFLSYASSKSFHEKGKTCDRMVLLRFLARSFFLKWNWSTDWNNKNPPRTINQSHLYTKPILSSNHENDISDQKSAQLSNKDSSWEVLKKVMDRPGSSWPFSKINFESCDQKERSPVSSEGRKAAGDHNCRSFGSKCCELCEEIMKKFKTTCLQRPREKGVPRTGSPEDRRDRGPHTPQRCNSADDRRYHEWHQHHVRPRRQTIWVLPVNGYLPDPTRDPNIDFSHVGYRLATLGALPASMPVSRIRLADAGFYFSGQGDEVTCYHCRKTYSGWRRGDRPLEVHMGISPECEHVLEMVRESQPSAIVQNGFDEGRQSLIEPASNHSHALAEDSHESRSRTIEHQQPILQASGSGRSAQSPANAFSRQETTSIQTPGRESSAHTNSPSAAETAVRQSPAGTNEGAASCSTSTSNTNTPSLSPVPLQRAIAQLGNDDASRSSTTAVVPPTVGRHASDGHPRPESRPLFPRVGLDLGGAVYPMYQDMQSRRRTFSSWNENSAPALDHIIMSGMFYAGYADCVRCFYCGVGLKHWLVTDDVTTEHVRWRPGCAYLRAIKGDDFIRETQNRLALPNSDTSRSYAADNTQSTAPASTISTSIVTAAAASQSTASAARTVISSSATTRTAAAAATSSSPTTALSSIVTTSTTSSHQTISPSAVDSSPSSAATSCSSSAITSSGTNTASNSAAALRTTPVSSAAEDSDTLAQLQEENHALARTFMCRVCHQANIDTILMPCGHLVVCEPCARSVMSCPLCQETIRATAKVHIS